MAIILCKPGTLHQSRPALQVQKPTRKAPRPATIAESYAKSTAMGRPPQSKAGQA